MTSERSPLCSMRRIGISEFLDLKDGIPAYDVRSPREYAQGHIPGLMNMPLFDDEERAVVGITYKKQGPEQAMLAGLDIVAPKMRGFVERVKKESEGGEQVALHCWRGGKRSESLAWLLEFSGFEVSVLEGGYKAYRRQLLDWFARKPLNLVILGGYTGSGKTEVLDALREQGAQVVDLEGLACHRGSAFGSLGRGEQPRSEQFENDLFEAFLKLDTRQPIWLENESRSIGRVFLPQSLWDRMREAPLVHIEVPLQLRVRRIYREYAPFPKDQLIHAFTRIRKRLGGQNHLAAIQALEAGDVETAIRIALRYYDKAYSHKGLHARSEIGTSHVITCSKDDPPSTAKTLIAYQKEYLQLQNT